MIDQAMTEDQQNLQHADENIVDESVKTEVKATKTTKKEEIEPEKAQLQKL